MALTQVQAEGIGDGEITSDQLANSGVTAGTYGSDSAIPAITVDAKGRITSASTNNVNIPPGVGGTNGVDFNDNVKARFGTGNDLEIFHDGTNSRIHDTGTGGLVLQGDAQINLQNASNENYIECVSNGAVTVYHDNNAKLATKSDGIDVIGEVQCDSLDVDGTSNLGGDLTVSSGNLIMHSGGRLFVGNGGNAVNPMIANGSDENTGIAFPAADNLLIAAGGDTAAKFIGNGAAELYHNSNKKLETTSSGVDITGDLTATGNVTAFSDVTLKKDIETIPNALDKVMGMRGVNFTVKESDVRSTGVIAQEIEEQLPEVVITNENGIKSVAYGNVVGVLIEAIKELKAEIEELKGGN